MEFQVGDIVKQGSVEKMVREVGEDGKLRLSTLDYPTFPEYHGSYWYSEVPPDDLVFIRGAGSICGGCEQRISPELSDYLCENCRRKLG